MTNQPTSTVPIPNLSPCASPSFRLPLAVPKEFCLAGKAKFTVKNEETGGRFTFKVSAPKDQRDPSKPIWFVKVLTGSDNESDYQFLGTLFDNGTTFRHSPKARISETAPSCVAFSWFWSHLTANKLPSNVHVYHEGSCGRCGRTLTVPESESGYGPECIKVMGGVL